MNIQFNVLPIQLIYRDGHQYDAVLSCVAPEENATAPFLIPEHLKNHVWLQCSDVGFMDWNVDDKYLQEWLKDIPDTLIPNTTHIQQAIDWGQFVYQQSKKRDMNVAVHCSLGMSRSPAFLYIILYSLYKDASVAIQKLKEIAPNAVPNPYIIQLADQYLQCDGILIENLKATFDYG